MKDLITISTYCPTIEKKQALVQLVLKLQEVRDLFDLLIVSHSPIDEVLAELVDFVYYDKNNEILSDFDLTNKFYYQNNNFDVESTLIFPKSTHLACYNLFHYSINFAKFFKYEKVHWVEYDFIPGNIDIIHSSSKILDDFDNFMIKDFTNDWVHGSYLAFNVGNLEFSNDNLNPKDRILTELRHHHSKHSEHITQSFLEKDNRSTHYFDLKDLILINNKPSSIDSHHNYDLNWVVPVYNIKNDKIDVFTYNEGGGNHNIVIIVNDRVLKLDCPSKLEWSIANLINVVEGEYLITVYVDNKITKEVMINKDNIEIFKRTNYIKHKK